MVCGRRSCQSFQGRLGKPSTGNPSVFDLAGAPSYAAEDFLTSQSNEAAHAAVTAWPHWIDRVLVLLGPEGSGKSHLAAIWRQKTGAHYAGSLDPLRLAGPSSAFVVEDCDRRALPEHDMFHALNRLREGNGWLLLTARTPPRLWDLSIADLVSRLRLSPTAVIDHPDEPLLKAVLVKMFSDRQIAIEEDVVAYAARHCEQSFAAAKLFVEAVDHDAMVAGARITRPLASRTLTRLSAQGPT